MAREISYNSRHFVLFTILIKILIFKLKHRYITQNKLMNRIETYQFYEFRHKMKVGKLIILKNPLKNIIEQKREPIFNTIEYKGV